MWLMVWQSDKTLDQLRCMGTIKKWRIVTPHAAPHRSDTRPAPYPELHDAVSNSDLLRPHGD